MNGAEQLFHGSGELHESGRGDHCDDFASFPDRLENGDQLRTFHDGAERAFAETFAAEYALVEAVSYTHLTLPTNSLV